MGVIVETPRLVLRTFTLDDLEALVELDSDPQVMRYINGGRPTPHHEVRDEVLPAFLAYHERGDLYGFFAAVSRSDGDFLGWFHYRPRPTDPPDEPELGYRLRRVAWGRGLATEGSCALIDRGFTDSPDVQRVTAETMVVNAASRRVMEKSGLRLVRTFHQQWPDRIPGDEHGDVEYALSRAEWCAARSSRAGDAVSG